MATMQPKDAAPVERMRKKPRLSLSSSSTSSVNTATTATTAAPNRLKSGLLPPSVATSRLHYAFGSRLPISGKENVANANNTTLKTSSNSHKHSEPLKKPDSDTTTQMGAKSALKRRPKRRASLQPSPSRGSASEDTASDDTAKKAKITATEPVALAAASAPATTGNAKAATAMESAPETPPTSKPASVVLSPVKPIEFRATTATDPEFWKCRQEFARKALLELKALEERMMLLPKSTP